MIIGLTQMLKDDFGIDFKNTALLDEAFTHASYVNEHPREKLKYYERIEFLGDAVMQLCVSEYLFKRYPTLPEGKLSRLRAAMVCEDSFSKFAKECHFDEYIRLGKGEEKANARNRASLLCDIFEAFIGALYLDQGKAVVVKVAKPKQDKRFDIPTVGLKTLRVMKHYGASVLALEAGETIIVNQEAMVKYADKNNMVILAV